MLACKVGETVDWLLQVSSNCIVQRVLDCLPGLLFLCFKLPWSGCNGLELGSRLLVGVKRERKGRRVSSDCHYFTVLQLFIPYLFILLVYCYDHHHPPYLCLKDSFDKEVLWLKESPNKEVLYLRFVMIHQCHAACCTGLTVSINDQ